MAITLCLFPSHLFLHELVDILIDDNNSTMGHYIEIGLVALT